MPRVSRTYYYHYYYSPFVFLFSFFLRLKRNALLADRDFVSRVQRGSFTGVLIIVYKETRNSLLSLRSFFILVCVCVGAARLLRAWLFSFAVEFAVSSFFFLLFSPFLAAALVVLCSACCEQQLYSGAECERPQWCARGAACR